MSITANMAQTFFYLLFTSLIFQTKAGTSCMWTLDETCQDGLFLVAKDVDQTTKRPEQLCCPQDEVSDQLESMEACKRTKCNPSSQADHACSSINPGMDRYVNGTKKLVWEELLRDPCRDESTGVSGFEQLCCLADSPEMALMSFYGAEPNEFPHQVRTKPATCGGTIYNENYVITAAHCVVNKGRLDYSLVSHVLIGTNNGKTPTDSKMYSYKVEEIIVHKGYSKLAENLPGNPDYDTYNDLALLKLERPVQFSNTVKALKIAPAQFAPRQYADRAIVVGWGTTATLREAPHLQKTDFLLRDDKVCYLSKKAGHTGTGFWDPRDSHEEQLICVGGVAEGKYSPTAGSGDSGGPLVCRDAEQKAVLCGVTSFGGNDTLCLKYSDDKNCPPSSYVDVGYFHDWIRENAPGGQEGVPLYRPYLYGKDVEEGEYSHQVYLTSSRKNCGGTLIAPDLVVTAAQCVVTSDHRRYDNLEVHVGVKELGQMGATYDVEDVRILDGFKMKGDPVDIESQKDRVLVMDNFYHSDLALLKLAKPVQESIRFPKLSDGQSKFQKGTDVSFPLETTMYKTLRARSMTLLEHAECQRRNDRVARQNNIDLPVDKDVVCGVEEYSGGSGCDRVLGGGLICKDGTKDVLCGIHTFRMCRFSLPYTYVDMTNSKNLAFIDQAKDQFGSGR